MVGLVEQIALKDVPARVAVSLLEYADASCAMADGMEFELARTQEELTAELATTRESGARIRIADVGRLGAAAGR